MKKNRLFFRPSTRRCCRWYARPKATPPMTRIVRKFFSPRLSYLLVLALDHHNTFSVLVAVALERVVVRESRRVVCFSAVASRNGEFRMIRKAFTSNTRRCFSLLFFFFFFFTVVNLFESAANVFIWPPREIRTLPPRFTSRRLKTVLRTENNFRILSNESPGKNLKREA